MNYFKLIILVSLVTTLNSCTKILDVDLTTAKVTVLSPSNGDTSPSVTKTFWWETVEGATAYNVQIASPSFDTNLAFALIIDTFLVKNKFVYTFKPDTHYEWRIAAKNGSTKTLYVTRSFYTKQAAFNTQKPVLIKPEDFVKDSISFTSVNFRWSPIPLATKYLLRIDTTSSGLKYFEHEVKDNSSNHSQYSDTTFTISKGKTYYWKVTAYNAANTASSTSSEGKFRTLKK